MSRTIGILGLQGDFSRHRSMLKALRVDTVIVRQLRDLAQCSALIIPGGESTTFNRLLRKTGLFTGIKEFAEEKPVMGTCAGLITLAADVVNDSLETLDLIDIRVERNGYGRQIDSFIDTVSIPRFEEKTAFEGVFIRAPRIISLGENVQPLGYHNDEIVMAASNRILVLAFHPELTRDSRIHDFFLREFVYEPAADA